MFEVQRRLQIFSKHKLGHRLPNRSQLAIMSAPLIFPLIEKAILTAPGALFFQLHNEGTHFRF